MCDCGYDTGKNAVFELGLTASVTSDLSYILVKQVLPQM